jgi:hypothetical protein
MKRKLRAGITSVSLPIIVYDNTSTTGAGLGGLTHTTSGLVLEYRRQGQSTWTSVTLVSKTLGTFTSGGIVASGSRTGRYEIDIPDAALAAGARFVEICLRGAANMHPVDIEIELDAVDYQTDAFGALKPTTAGRTLDVSAGGEAGIDLANVGSPTATLSLSGTTIKAVTDAVALPSSASINITGNITGNLSGSVGSVTGSVGSVTGNVGGNVAGSVNSVTSPVTVGTNNDKTGYALTQAFPSNFAALGINGSGHISRVTLVDTTTTNTDMRGTDNAALASNWTATRAGYLDSVLIAANSNRTVMVTGSNHVAADIHELQPAVIDNTHFAAGAIDSNALAASAATEIATAVGGLTQMVDLTTMIVNDGTANARFSTSALQNAPSGGGGGGTGTGARTVAITVTLSAAPVEGASVRLTKAAETYVGSTNASGQITFNVDDGTWAVAITSPNATFAGASLVVDDDETVSYSLTAISITPSPAGQMTGYWTCYSHLGVVESGVSVTMQLVDVPKGSKGLALDSKLRTVTANGSGVAQFTNLFPGCRYKVYRGAADNKAFYVTLPEVAPADPVELGSFYGDDE